MMTTLFLSADGKPMSAAQFLESLFGILPDFFKDEDELRSIWGGRDTELNRPGFRRHLHALN